MVARWMQPKIMKIKKQMRAKPRPLYGIDRHRGYFNDQGDWVDMNLGSTAKAASSGICPHQGSFEKVKNRETAIERQPWLDTKFKDRNPLFKWDGVKYIPDEAGICVRAGGEYPNPRALIVYRTLQGTGPTSGTHLREERFVYGKIIDANMQKLGLYMGRDICFFMEWQKTGSKEVLKRSINYTGRSIALAAQQRGSITWKHVVPFHPPNEPSSTE